MTKVNNSVFNQIQACPAENTPVRNKEEGRRLFSQPGVVSPTGDFDTGWNSAKGINVGVNATFAIYRDAVYTGKIIEGSASKFDNPLDQATLKDGETFTLMDCEVKNPTVDELGKAPIVHNLEIKTSADNLSVYENPITGRVETAADLHLNVRDKTNAQFFDFPKSDLIPGVGLIYGLGYNRFYNSKIADYHQCLNESAADSEAYAACKDDFPEDSIGDKYHTNMTLTGGYAFEVNRPFDEDAESTLDPFSFEHVFNFRVFNSSIDPTEKPSFLASHTMGVSSAILAKDFSWYLKPSLSRTVTDGADEQFGSSQDNNTKWTAKAGLTLNPNKDQEANKQYVDGWLSTVSVSHARFGNNRLDALADGHSTTIYLNLENTLPAWTNFALRGGSFDKSFKLTELAGKTKAPFYVGAGLKWGSENALGNIGAIRPDGEFAEIDDCYDDFADGGSDGVCHAEGQESGGVTRQEAFVPYKIGVNLPLPVQGERIFRSGLNLGISMTGELEPRIMKALFNPALTLGDINRGFVVDASIGGNF